MGQSASTARDPPDTGYPDYHTSFSAERNPDMRNEDMNNEQATEQNGGAGSSSGAEIHHHNDQDMALDQSHEQLEDWQQPARFSGDYSNQMRSIEEEHDAEYELPDRELRSAAMARMARRQSTMSRLGSRILPNSVIRGLLSSTEETPAEGHAHRHGQVPRTPVRSETAHSTSRFSPFQALGSRGITRRRTSRTPYFIPPRAERADSTVLSDAATDSIVEATAQRLPEPARSSWRRSARLHRMRHSLPAPISNMFGQSQSDMASSHESPSYQPVRQSFDDILPSPMDTRLDFGEPLPELDSVEPGVSNGEPLSSNQPNPGVLGMRRLPGLIRARSARALRREEQTPLSRVLQLAAAAIAAQLSGTTGPALPNIQALGNDGLEGSLENFIQSLQHATNAQSQPTAPGEGSSNPGPEGPSPPVNFLRVFRFANSESPLGPNLENPANSSNTNATSENSNGPDTQGAPSNGMSLDDPPEGGEGRTVTLVVVGVRSVPSSNGGNGGNGEQGAQGAGGPGLDALLGLPFLPPNAIPRPAGVTGDLAQRPDGIGGMNPPRPAVPTFRAPSVPELLRQPGLNPSRRLSDAGLRPGYPSFPPSALSESPPGPHPPPSTPAEHGVSAVSSGTSTPSRRPSSASAMSPSILPHLHEGYPLQSTAEPTEEPVAPSAARQRRRSDSEYARHRALGSGSVRRNGMVEPDQPSPSGGRSWLIYVVGTNLSENHPALTTPSLFTDNPTYEDMILLSSLLGPAKPPVASQDDINSAGGLFRLVENAGSLVAEFVDGTGSIQMSDGERCLICLSDYEVGEEVRELNKCKHVFHKDCIDQWLTTGRNSCPLCRGQGVVETSNDNSAPTSEAAPAAVPTPAAEPTDF
ncbi:40S ribosomal protein Rps16 [Penicillium atrosanguineum]|uniref:RING-type domain-containing protein n=1 Tax=Penicillium atrosanguineum TaxID=1132637 RepID=A0A9W9U8E9_9EURO|nr:40S ribosomal protein Rps16 [Penicillium atrosanguineum]KAJ5305334.1 40S ribosomal protein Rps16 [Penicillium atrosanguineum]KAJ5324796.1 hypothetical protein N7476_003396 [Penicillium atrosanguineum]